MIRPAFSYNELSPPQKWSELPQGEWLREQVEQQLQAYWPRLPGHHMALLGDGLYGRRRCHPLVWPAVILDLLLEDGTQDYGDRVVAAMLNAADL